MKNTLSILIGLTSIFSLCSCDSGGDTATDPLTDPTALAISLNVPAEGDRIAYTSTTSPVALFNGLTFLSTSTTVLNSVYIYQKTGVNTFNIDIENQTANRLTNAIDTTIGEPTPLSARLRELLLRDDAIFTNAELREIINILNPAGSSLIIDPDNSLQINSSNNRLYRHRITSNNADKIIGSIGGVYIIEETNFVVDFREPTQAELNRYRLLTINHKIPFLTTTQNVKQVIERGTFIMELENVNNAPR